MKAFKIRMGKLLVGLFLVAFATCFYIDSAFGAGPRDSLMVAIERKTGLPVVSEPDLWDLIRRYRS